MATPVDELTEHSLENLDDGDLLFLVRAFADKRTDYENIVNLVHGDVQTIDQMVGNDRVFQKLMDQSTTIESISPYFFFTLLLRRALKDVQKSPEPIEAGLEDVNQHGESIPWTLERAAKMLSDQSVTNYLSNMISAFIRTSRMFRVSAQDEQSYEYLVDLIQDLQQSNSTRRFWIYCHIGNYALFLTGLFPEFIEHRRRFRRRPVDERFYIDFGRTYYGLAGDHQLARRTELDHVLSQLSSGFEIVKQFLNYVTRSYLRHSLSHPN